jgi:hypothetical protein
MKLRVSLYHLQLIPNLEMFVGCSYLQPLRKSSEDVPVLNEDV